MTFFEWINNALFGGPTDTSPYLGVESPYASKADLPAFYNPASGGYTTHLTQEEFGTPDVAQAVAAALGGSVAAPSVASGPLSVGVLPSGKFGSAPAQSQVIIPGMAGTQNAGLLYKTMKDAAAAAYKGPSSNLANNVGDNPQSAVYLIGSLAVPYDTWAKYQATLGPRSKA